MKTSINAPQTNINVSPRTVEQVRELDAAISKYDYLMDRAHTRGQLETSMRYDAILRELTDAMSAVSDALWGKYCEQLMLQEEV